MASLIVLPVAGSDGRPQSHKLSREKDRYLRPQPLRLFKQMHWLRFPPKFSFPWLVHRFKHSFECLVVVRV